MSTLRRLPGLYVALAVGALVSLALSLLVLSGVFEPRTTVTGSISFDACNGGQPDDACIRQSHVASGVAIEYRTLGFLPVPYRTHTGRDGLYRLNLPPGKYQVVIAGCKSWSLSATDPPQTAVTRVAIDPNRLSYSWVIFANGTCEIGGWAL